MKLILVRHGETESNVKETLQGHLPGKLTYKGKAQAVKLALRLKDEKIDAIFSSDLQRSVDTTIEIAKFHNLSVHYTPELRERNLGKFEGEHYSELKNAQAKSDFPKVDFVPEKGESYRDLRKRVGKFLDGVVHKYHDKTILISSHGGFNRMALGILLGKPIEEAAELEQHNACINIIGIDENSNHTAHLINSIDHL